MIGLGFLGANFFGSSLFPSKDLTTFFLVITGFK